MLPANQSEPSFSDVVSNLMDRFRDWVKQEIVDDDPWDKESLFPESLESKSETAEPRDASLSDRSKTPR